MGEEEVKPFRWTGRAWRGGSDSSFPRGATVADIVRYEQDELGNDINVTKATLKKLEKIPATRSIWVTKTKRDAQHYGTAYEVNLGDDCVAVGMDGDGGYLVVLPE
jgi:hypothetical protein